MPPEHTANEVPVEEEVEDEVAPAVAWEGELGNPHRASPATC